MLPVEKMTKSGQARVLDVDMYNSGHTGQERNMGHGPSIDCLTASLWESCLIVKMYLSGLVADVKNCYDNMDKHAYSYAISSSKFLDGVRWCTSIRFSFFQLHKYQLLINCATLLIFSKGFQGSCSFRKHACWDSAYLNMGQSKRFRNCNTHKF